MTGRRLTAQEVADRWGLTAGTILDWFEAGKLPGFKLGGTKYGRVRFREEDVEAMEVTWATSQASPSLRAVD